MKKTLIALAALGVVGAASAQVAITGSIGFGIQNVMGTPGAKFDLTDADINFSGSEDLGGGLSVSVSTSISNEALRSNGTTANNTAISLKGGFGSIAYSNVLSGSAKMGGPSVEDDLSDVLGGYSTVNVFNYTTPELFAGFTASAEWAGDDATATAASGTPTLIGNYKSGPVSVYVDNGGTSKVWDMRVTYDAGVAQLGLRVDKDKYQEVAITVPSGAITYGLNMVSKSTIKGTGFSMSYAMSKQTSVKFGYVSSSVSASTLNSGNGGNNYRLQLVKAF
jgi:hypothetical protein